MDEGPVEGGRLQRRSRATSLVAVMRRTRQSQAFAGWMFALPLALALILVVAIPVINALRISLYSNDFTGAETFVGLGNYANVVGDRAFLPVLWNTTVWTVFSVIGQVGLGLVAAMAINQKLRGIHFFRSILLMPYVVPAVALALLTRWLLDSHYGLVSYLLQGAGLLPLDTTPLSIEATAMPTVIIANIWRGFPFAMIIYWAALQGIDQEQYEAARVDGANSWHAFRFITVPNLRGATITLLVLRGIWSVTYFDLVWLITGGGPLGATETWPVWIYREAIGRFRFGYASAIATFMALVLIVLIVIYIKVSRFGREEDRA